MDYLATTALCNGLMSLATTGVTAQMDLVEDLAVVPRNIFEHAQISESQELNIFLATVQIIYVLINFSLAEILLYKLLITQT